MHLRPTFRRERALTLIEVMLVIVLLFILGGLVLYCLLPTSTSSRRAPRIHCSNNLKQIGLSYKVFANDNDDKFPFQVTNSLAFGNITQTWMHFQAMSNEMGSAKILICRADLERVTNMCFDFSLGLEATATSLSTRSNAAVSYAASLDAHETLPEVILVSDRHLLTTPGNLAGRLYLAVSNAAPASWTTNLHNSAGNYALSDGSVQQVTSANLASQIQRQGISTNRLLLPLLP